jgi:hypothetical protein
VQNNRRAQAAMPGQAAEMAGQILILAATRNRSAALAVNIKSDAFR